MRGENFYYNPKDVQVISELAQNLQRYTTNYTEALEYAELALVAKKTWVTPIRIKAETYLKMGRIEEANAEIDKALQLRQFFDGLMVKGDVMKQMERWQEAETFYRRAMQMKPESTEAKVALANTISFTLGKSEARFQEAELL